MQKVGRLELTWVGKYEEDRFEPRILIEDKEKSYGDASSDNMLIHGDNLLALKALERDYTGKSGASTSIHLTIPEMLLNTMMMTLSILFGLICFIKESGFCILCLLKTVHYGLA